MLCVGVGVRNMFLPQFLTPTPSATAFSTAVGMTIDVNTSDASFVLSVDNRPWLRSAPVRAFIGGAWRAPILTGHVTTEGTDPVLGSYRSINLTWAVGPEAVPLHTSILVHRSGEAVIFVTDLPKGARGTNASNPVLPPTWQPPNTSGHQTLHIQSRQQPRAHSPPNNSIPGQYHDNGMYPPSIAFPSFDASAGLSLLSKLRFLTWSDCMSPSLHGRNVTDSLQGLTTSAPVVLFDENRRAIVVGPLDNFKSVVNYRKPALAHVSE